MKVALTQEVSTEISQEKSNLITSFSIHLHSAFEGLNYGEAVKEILFGVICVAPEFEWFCKVRRPRLQKLHKTYLPDGTHIVSENILSMDIKLNYEDVRTTTNSDTFSLLKKALLDNLNELEKYKGKFDYQKFKVDMESELRQFDYAQCYQIMKSLLSQKKK